MRVNRRTHIVAGIQTDTHKQIYKMKNIYADKKLQQFLLVYRWTHTVFIERETHGC